MSVSRVERDPAGDCSILQSDPCLGLRCQIFLVEQDLPAASHPISVPTITSVTTEAEIHTVAGEIHPGQFRVPLETPAGQLRVSDCFQIGDEVIRIG